MFAPLLFAAITFNTGFEGASLGRTERVDSGHYRLHVAGDTDQDKRNRQASWYYFRVDGARGRHLVLDIVDLPGEYNYRPNRGAIIAETLPFYSEDQRTWRPVEAAEFDDSVPLLRIRIRPRAGRVWIAHQPPYTNRQLAALLADVRGHPALSVQAAGKTVKGRDIPLLTITDRSVPDVDKKVLWILFRQHSWEAGSSWAGEGAIRFLLSDSPDAAVLRRSTLFKIFPLCDPDGVAAGRVRFNAFGYDLNRNWDVSDPVKMPEIAAQRRAVLEWIDAGGRVDMLVTLHNSEKPEYIEGGPGREHEPLMKRFEELLSRSPVFAPNRAAVLSTVSTTVGQPGRMAVHQGLYKDRKIPAFLIEQMIVKHPKLGRQPGIEDRVRFGEDLVRAMTAALPS